MDAVASFLTNVFRGISNATLDSKGRMALPAKSREAVLLASAGKVVVTIDMREPCLLCYPLPEWEVVQRKLEGLSNINQEARLLQRLLIGHATDLELDGSGRILLPSMLRDYADLKKKLVLVGQGTKIEFWAEGTWQSQMNTWLGRDRQAEDGSPDGVPLLGAGDAFTGLSV